MELPFSGTAAGLLLAGAALGATAWGMLPPRLDACAQAAPAPLDALAFAEPPVVGALRIAAAGGDLDASAELADLLLDRYELAHDGATLVEALQWLQRDWEDPGFRAHAQLARVVHGPCRNEPLLRLHWLCQQGE